MGNARPQRNNELAKLEKAVQAAKELLSIAIPSIQDNCSHDVVYEIDNGNGDMRICPSCGREEHTPYYHSFWFKELYADKDRWMITTKNSSEFYAMRLDFCHKIFYNGE